MMNSETTISKIADILGQEDYLICDTSLTGLEEEGGWYHDHVYDAHSFSQLNTGLLTMQKDSLESFLSLMSDPKAITVRGVSLELKRTRDMISQNIRFLGAPRGKYAGNGEDGRRLLETIRDLYHALYTTSRRSLFVPSNRKKYSCLEEITLKITERTHAKVDESKKYMPVRATPKNVEDFHTDERLVAAALYLSIVEGKKGGIITRDGDIRRILINTLKHGNLSGAIDMVRQNRIKVYYLTALQEAGCCFDTSEFLSR